MVYETAPVSDHLRVPLRPGLDEQALAAGEVINQARDRVWTAAAGTPDEGYFPEGSSVLRMVQGSRSVGLLFGQMGLMIGGTDPLNYIGTSDHTKNRQLPFRRLVETAEAFEIIFFGTRAEADLKGNQIFLMHTRVVGDTSEETGPYPTGTAYKAFDPARLLWTMACIAYPAKEVYETLERPLTEPEREEFWQEYLLFGELFGLSRDHPDVPKDYGEFEQYMQQRFNGKELHLTAAAKYMGEQVCFNMPILGFPQFARRRMNGLFLGMLPPEVRRMYGLAYTADHEEDFQRAVSTVTSVKKHLPEAIVRGGNPLFYKLVTAGEKWRKLRGMQAVMPERPY